MIDNKEDKVNCMAIAIAKSRGVKPKMIKLNRRPRSRAGRENFLQYVTFSWCPYMDEAKKILAAYDRELENPRLR